MGERKYLPTFAELVDRLSIVQLKEIFIPDHKESYRLEIKDIIHDLDIMAKEKDLKLSGEFIKTIMIIMLTNRYIWENEAKARMGGTEQDKLLKMTHSINGIRSTAKNVISFLTGERVDLKIDCLAAELGDEFGNWRIFE